MAPPTQESPSLRLPGFGLPVRYELDLGCRYGHGALDVSFERMTVRELSMLRVMEALTDKPNWSKKVFDSTITDKWRKEALQIPWMTEKTFDWCLTELQDKAYAYEATKLTTVLDMGSRCVKADHLVPTELRDALKAGVQPLLDHTPRDWHPGSNGQVLNLVHPSLYPLVYGKSPVLKRGNIDLNDILAPQDETAVLPLQDVLPDSSSIWPGSRDDAAPFRWSDKFQWLPCDVSFVGPSDTSVKITSYINNLHPTKHQALYGIIERFISLSIPAWNEVLVRDENGRTPLRIKTSGAETNPVDVPEWADALGARDDENNEENVAKVNEYLALPDRPENEDDEPIPGSPDGDLLDLVHWKFRRVRETIHPEPGVSPSHSYADWKAGKLVDAFYPSLSQGFEWTTVELEKTFRESGLQVIVKLASIELTPDNPSYPGGNWHIEGMLNEHIVATSIYYYDVSNITESRIRFRQEARLDSVTMAYEQHDHMPLCQLFGTEDLTDERAIQEIGSIATPENRLLAFPNTLQHRVDPFTLADVTKPGHRRFLVLWLVDPHYRVLSTANVPPQQHEWWVERARHGIAGKVPLELQGMIEQELMNGTMTLEEAKAYRLELMAERTQSTEIVQDGIDRYNFCEH